MTTLVTRTRAQLTRTRAFQNYMAHGEPEILMRRAARIGGVPELWVETAAGSRRYAQVTSVHDRAEVMTRAEARASWASVRQAWLKLQAWGTDRYFSL